MEFILPPYKSRVPIRGVYKITIDNKWFYIGGSFKVKARIVYWKILMKRHAVPRNMKLVLKETSVIKFEIIENVADKINVRPREDYFIKVYFDDPLCLNHCPSAFDNKGIEKIKGVKPKVKIKGYESPPKMVGKFSLDGLLLERFSSVYYAEKATGISRNTIVDVMKGRASRYKDLLFKEIDANGNIINNIQFVPKNRHKPHAVKHRSLTDQEKLAHSIRNKNIYKITPSAFSHGTKPKKITAYTMNMVLIKEFDSVTAAHKELNVEKGNICRVAKGRVKSTNGYIFRYSATE